MWPFKRKKESEGPVPYSEPTPPKAAASFAPPLKTADESRNWAVVVLDKRAGSGSGADLDTVLMTDLQLERDEMGRFYHSQSPFVVVQRVTRPFAENAVKRLALAGVLAKAESMSEPALPQISPQISIDTALPNTPLNRVGDYSVVLVNTGRKKIEVIKTIREYTKLGLKEAKDLADQTPSVLATHIDEAAAHQLARDLQAAGATVQVSPA